MSLPQEQARISGILNGLGLDNANRKETRKDLLSFLRSARGTDDSVTRLSPDEVRGLAFRFHEDNAHNRPSLQRSCTTLGCPRVVDDLARVMRQQVQNLRHNRKYNSNGTTSISTTPIRGFRLANRPDSARPDVYEIISDDEYISDPSPQASSSPFREEDSKPIVPASAKRCADETPKVQAKRSRLDRENSWTRTKTVDGPNPLFKANDEWLRRLKEYLQNCSYSVERHVVDLDISPPQQLFSRILSRGDIPTPSLKTYIREVHLTVKQHSETTKNVLYILKQCVFGDNISSRPLHTSFQIIRKGFDPSSAREAFWGWYFDNLQGELAARTIPEQSTAPPVEMDAGGDASRHCGQHPTCESCQQMSLNGCRIKKIKACQSRWTQTVAASKINTNNTVRAGAEENTNVEDTITVAADVARMELNLETEHAPAQGTNTTNQSQTRDGLQHRPDQMAPHSFNSAQPLTTRLITGLSDPEVHRGEVEAQASKDQGIHRQGQSSPAKAVAANQKCYISVIPTTISSADIPDPPEPPQRLSMSDIIKLTATEPLQPARPKQALTQSFISGATISDIPLSSATPLTASTAVHPDPAGTCHPFTQTVTAPQPRQPSTPALDRSKSHCTDSSHKILTYAHRISMTRLRAHEEYWREQSQEAARCRHDAAVAGEEEDEERYRSHEEELEVVCKIFGTLTKFRAVVPGAEGRL